MENELKKSVESLMHTEDISDDIELDLINEKINASLNKAEMLNNEMALLKQQLVVALNTRPLEDLQAENSFLKKELENGLTALKAAEQRIANFQEKTDEKLREKGRIEASFTELQVESQQILTENKRLERELESSNEERSELKNRLTQFEKERTEIIESNRVRLMMEVEKLYQDRISKLEQELSLAKASKQTEFTDIDRMIREVESLKSKVKSKNQHILDLNSFFSKTAKEKIDNIELSKLVEMNRSLMKEIDSLTIRIFELEKENLSLRNYQNITLLQA